MLLRGQACKVEGLELPWQEAFAGKLLEMLLRELRAQQDAPTSFSQRRPCAAEMLEWLRESCLQQLVPVFIASGLESLQVCVCARARACVCVRACVQRSS